MSTEVGKLYVQFDADGRPYIQGLRDIDRRTRAFTRDQQSAFDKFGANIGRTIKTGMAVGAAALGSGVIDYLLFVLGRTFNRLDGRGDVLWQRGRQPEGEAG